MVTAITQYFIFNTVNRCMFNLKNMEKGQDLPKLSKSLLNINGTKVNNQSNQLLISSGIASLDELLGGGIPVGTVVFLEEDQNGTYSKIMLKYFLAEGVVNKHSILIASQDTSTDNIIQELPAVNAFDPEPLHGITSNTEKMKIAFRYQNLPTSEKQKIDQFGHFYDLTKVMPRDLIEKSDIVHWKKPSANNDINTFSNPAYHDLLESIKNKIRIGQFGVNDKPERRSILRIGIHALGSPMWLCDSSEGFMIPQNRDLNMFIYCLRALARSAFAIAFVTVPSHLLERSSIDRCIYSSDIAIKLHSFSGTELENNSVLSEYHGFFHLTKLAAINTFVSKHPGPVEYVFKLRRKKFYIDKLHLPPDLGDSTSEDVPSAGCGSSTKHLLEF